MITVVQYLVIAAVIGAAMFGIAVFVFGRGEQMAPLPARVSPVELPAGDLRGDHVRRVRFGLALRGYRMSDVDWALERLADEIDVLHDRLDSMATDSSEKPDTGPANSAAIGAAADLAPAVAAETDAREPGVGASSERGAETAGVAAGDAGSDEVAAGEVMASDDAAGAGSGEAAADDAVRDVRWDGAVAEDVTGSGTTTTETSGSGTMGSGDADQASTR